MCEAGGQIVQELRVRRLVVLAEVIHRVGETAAEEVQPQPINICLGEILAVANQFGQFLPAILVRG